MDGASNVAMGSELIAQASGQPIGRIDTLAGSGAITRVDGSVVQAEKGTPVFQGDTVETAKGGKVGIVFADNTTFALGENGQMRMDEMVYNPQTKSGNLGLSMLKGAFVMVTGEIAPSSTDAMTIRTPVGTIGIRGTKVAGNLDISQGLVLSLLPDPVGRPAAVVVSNAGGTQFITEANTGLQVSSYNTAPGAPQPMSSLPGAGALADVLAQVLAFADSLIGQQILQAINQVADAQAAERTAAARDADGKPDVQPEATPNQITDSKVIVTDVDTKLANLLDQTPDLPTITPIYNYTPTTTVTPTKTITPQEQEQQNQTTPTLTGTQIVGTDRAEWIFGTTGNDALKGMGGNDTIIGLIGNDSIDGGAGDDVIQAIQPADFYENGIAIERPVLKIDGGAGYDIVTVGLTSTHSEGDYAYFDAEVTNVEKLYVDLSQNNDAYIGFFDDNAGTKAVGQINLIGTVDHVHIDLYGEGDGFNINASGLTGNNDFTGSYNSDTIIAGAGNDTINGGGESGSDYLDGGAGNDIISGTYSDDTILGGAGSDTIYGNGGQDSVNAGAGNDKVYLDPYNYSSTVIGGAGNDFIEVAGGYGESNPLNGALIDGGAGVDTLALGGSFYETYIGPSANITGIDVVEISGVSSGIADYAFDFGSKFFAASDQNNDGILGDIRFAVTGNTTYLSINAKAATQGMILDAYDNLTSNINITGGSGNDTIMVNYLGGEGGFLSGGAGNDLFLVENLSSYGAIDGGIGNDTVIAGPGQIFYDLNLGAGDDVLRVITTEYSGFTGLGSGSSGIDRLEYIVDQDTAVGGSGINIGDGALGNTDVLEIQGYGFTGDYDPYIAGAGDGYGNVKNSVSGLGATSIGTSISASSSSNGGAIHVLGGFNGDDSMYGGAGNDTISAGEGDDFVAGNGGTDWLYGGAGDDSLFDGAGGGMIDGGAGNDWINIETASITSAAYTLSGGAGNDSIYASAFGDVIVGGAGSDTIYGGGGNDTINVGGNAANAGNHDYVTGGDGTDSFTGTLTAGNFTSYVYSDASEGGDVFATGSFKSGLSEIVLEGGSFPYISQSTHIKAISGSGSYNGGSNYGFDSGAYALLYTDTSTGKTSLIYDDNGNDTSGGYSVIVSDFGGNTVNTGDIKAPGMPA
jgi:Ca2+-binding RTX toxin-like protein